MFISARVDRWSAAARLLIGASPPVSHTHIDSLSSLLVQQPSCTPRPSASFLSPSLPFLFLFLSVSSYLSSPLVSSSSSSISSSCLSLYRYFHPLGLSAAVCLPIIPPPPLSSPLQRPSFFSMSTNNSLPFYPYFLFRFSPAYSKTAESPLFPSHIYALFLSHSSSELRRFLPLFTVASIKAAVSKPIVLHPSLSCTRSRFFPLQGFFSRCYCRLSNASQFAMADFPQRQLQYLISIGKSDECYLYRHCP